jgi:hypothetical protein
VVEAWGVVAYLELMLFLIDPMKSVIPIDLMVKLIEVYGLRMMVVRGV